MSAWKFSSGVGICAPSLSMLNVVEAAGLVILGVCVATPFAEGVTLFVLIGLKSTLSLRSLVIPVVGERNSGISCVVIAVVFAHIAVVSASRATLIDPDIDPRVNI